MNATKYKNPNSMACDYCGKANDACQMWIGAPPPDALDDLTTGNGFTIHEGTGKISCRDCRPAGAREAAASIKAIGGAA